jgi:hypothetical protein
MSSKDNNMPDNIIPEAQLRRVRVADAIQLLAHTLRESGFEPEGVPDDELIEIAIRRLRTLHAMVIATGISGNLLKAVMKEERGPRLISG